MPQQHSLSLDGVRPFIRHVQQLPVRSGEYPVKTCSYDCRLFYVYRGKGNIYIRKDSYAVRYGCLVLWQADVPYRMDSADSSMQFLCVNFDLTQNHSHEDYPIPPEPITQFRRQNVMESVTFTDIPQLNQPVFLREMQEVEDALLEMKREYTSRMRFFRTRLSGIMQSILIQVSRKLMLPSSELLSKNLIVDQVIDYIHAHYHEPISNSELGRIFNYHPNYLNKLMIQRTDKTIHQYLMACRIAGAIDGLGTTSASEAEIAQNNGFGSIWHMSKIFKQKTGRNPSFYRYRKR